MSIRRKKILILIGLTLTVGLSCKAFAAKSPWEGTRVKWLLGTGHNAVAGTVVKEVAEKELGIKVELVMVPGVQHREFVLKDWKTGGGEYDIVTMQPRDNAEVMGLGYFIPLNEYMDKYNAWDIYNNILPTYRGLYCEWGGKVYAFVQDGDITFMMYRKDIFSDPTIQAKFKAEYGYDLKAPDTMEEMLDVCSFFNGWDWDGDGKKEYGFQWTVWRRDFHHIHWLALFGGYGGIPFDENMKPLVNTEPGVKALELMKEILKVSPPGALGMNVDECFASFLNGEVALGLYFPDIGRLVYSGEAFAGAGGPEWKGKIGYAFWPKTVYKGVERRYACMSQGRIIGISKFSKVKDAAFQVLKLADRPDVANRYIINAKSGADPFLKTQLNPKVWWEDFNYPVDEDYLHYHLESMKYGYPAIMIPGNEEYNDSLNAQCDAYLAGMVDSAKIALDTVAKDWDAITMKWGRDEQKAVWKEVIKKFEAIGIHLPK